MNPTERDFKAPLCDFFKPRGKDHVDFLGIEAHLTGYNFITEYNIEKHRQRHEKPISKEDITKIYINDLEGWSIQFSQKVEYRGNYAGGINLKFNSTDQEINFSYDQIARIRKRNGTVIWENAHTSLYQQLLTK